MGGATLTNSIEERMKNQNAVEGDQIMERKEWRRKSSLEELNFLIKDLAGLELKNFLHKYSIIKQNTPKNLNARVNLWKSIKI